MSVELLTALERDGALTGLRLPADVAVAEPLKGHASRRRFVRLRRSSGATVVLVVYPFEERADLERYVRVARWLRDAEVRVPAILERGERALLVEDVGPDRLDRRTLDPGRRRRAYRQALDAIIRIQRRGIRHESPNPTLALDRARLAQELEFFERHTMRGWLEVGGGSDRRARLYERLADAVSRIPTAQCHRDYHSRNLMLSGDRVALVDFQDQMEGPCLYDLASLVQDDYRDVERSIRAELLHRWWLECRPRLAVRSDARLPDAPAGLPPEIRQAFCLVALQRNLKALGTFGYQVREAGRADYAAFAPRTWGWARRNLALLGWSDVRELTVPLERAFG